MCKMFHSFNLHLDIWYCLRQLAGANCHLFNFLEAKMYLLFQLTACPLNTSVSWTTTPDVGLPCQISSLCTGIECCVHANSLLRDFQTRIIVDPCQFVVSIGIDNYIHNISLSKFEYGKYLLFCSYFF